MKINQSINLTRSRQYFCVCDSLSLVSLVIIKYKVIVGLAIKFMQSRSLFV